MEKHKLLLWSKIYFPIILLAFCCLGISVYKAAHASFTHDEGVTYLTYVKKNTLGIISMQSPASANNHILNTLSMKVVDKLLNPSPINLRLPNLFAHFLFLVFSALIVADFKSNYYKVAAFMMLNANVYLIDLFSLARGYGLSLGFIMIHWYYLLKLMSNDFDIVKFRLMIIALMLSIVSNFSIIYYALSLGFVYVTYELIAANGAIKFRKVFTYSGFKFLSISLLLMLAFLYEPIRKLIKFKQLYFGGTNNIFDDTIYSLVYYSASSSNTQEFMMDWIYRLVLISLVLLIIVLIVSLVRKKWARKSNFFIGVLLMILLLQITFFYVFNTKYLIQRTAVFLIPLFTLAILQLIDELSSKTLYLLTSVLAVFFCYNTFRYVPRNSSINWICDADNERLIADLHQIQKNKYPNRKLRLGIHWIFEPSINYYRMTSNAGLWLDSVDRNGYEHKIFEYYFVESQSLNKFADTARFELVKTYSKSGNLLIKNKTIEQY